MSIVEYTSDGRPVEMSKGPRVDVVSSRYLDADLDLVIWEHRLDGLSDSVIAGIVGIRSGRVRRSLERMLSTVHAESSMIAREWAVRETMCLWVEVYTVAALQWRECKDPRYAEVMRGALADIRRIWGVDAPQRLAVAHFDGGIVNSELVDLSKDQLEILAAMFPEICEEVIDADSEGFEPPQDFAGSGI